jgi:hypothetical protein
LTLIFASFLINFRDLDLHKPRNPNKISSIRIPSLKSSKCNGINQSSNQIPRPSPSSPWQAWTLDQEFLRQVYEWNTTHPETLSDHILSRLVASTPQTLNQHKDLFEAVPDGPIPIRGFVKALAHLVKLGAVSNVDSHRCQLQLNVWVDYC